jgi:hypothetical protein
MDVEVDRVLRTLTGPGPLVGMAGSISSNIEAPTVTDVAFSNGVDPLTVNSDEAIPVASSDLESRHVSVVAEGDPLQPTPEAAANADTTSMEGILHTPQAESTPNITQAVGSGDPVAESLMHTPADFHAIIQTTLKDVNKLIAVTCLQLRKPEYLCLHCFTGCIVTASIFIFRITVHCS